MALKSRDHRTLRHAAGVLVLLIDMSASEAASVALFHSRWGKEFHWQPVRVSVD
jgi:hypothetical protein